MATWRQVGEEVLYSDQATVLVDGAVVAELKRLAAGTRRRRMRLCAHPDPTAPVHDMIIVHGRDAYVRPHRHPLKAESLHVIEGLAQALFFDVSGRIDEIAALGPASSNRHFFYRMPPGRFHALVIESDWFVFAEATQGPFMPDTSEFPIWAPPENSSVSAEYFAALRAAAIGGKSSAAPAME